MVKGVASPQLRPLDGGGFDEEPSASRSRKRLNKKRVDSDSDDDNSDDGRSIATTSAKKPCPEVLASDQDTAMHVPWLHGLMAVSQHIRPRYGHARAVAAWPHGCISAYPTEMRPCTCRGCMASWLNLGISDRDAAMPVPWLHGLMAESQHIRPRCGHACAVAAMHEVCCSSTV